MVSFTLNRKKASSNLDLMTPLRYVLFSLGCNSVRDSDDR